jgi:predicted nucleic acid-binding protein
MMLVDTSVWIDHLRTRDDALGRALEEGEVATHSFVIGELACGNLRNRTEILSLLDALPPCIEASHFEVMQLIDQRRLMARGIGYVDAHLIAATMLSPETQLWTRDRRLAQVAKELGVLSRR